MAKSAKTGGMSNSNPMAVVEPKALGKPMHGLNPNATVMPSYNQSGGEISKAVSKDIKNMRDTLMEMPDGRSVSTKSSRD